MHKTGRLVYQVVKGYFISKSAEENTSGQKMYLYHKLKTKCCVTKTASNINMAVLPVA